MPLVNVVGFLSKNDLFDSATYITELTYNRLQKVTANPNAFYGVGYAACATNKMMDGCATREYWGLALQFEPKWYQVWSGVDLSLPMFLQTGLKGNSPLVFGGWEGNGSYSLGLTGRHVEKILAEPAI